MTSTVRGRLSGPVGVAAAVLIAALALGGCNGKDDKDDAAKPAPTSAAPGKGDASPSAAKSGGDASKSPASPKSGMTGNTKAPAGGFPGPRDPEAPPVTTKATPDTGAAVLVPGTVAYKELSRTHVSGPVVYAVDPPVGGEHDPVWANCGVYREEVPSRNAVHAMEHGAVWITYRPDLPKDQIALLEQQLRGKPYVLLSPYPGLGGPVAASAWGLQLRLDDPADPRLGQFVTAYASGRQTPEPGAPCTGGLGKPAL
ncbi:DUF3105 domain-containing protein [Yinghuangia seranimata]|uniref:DUF3105 domain-containing protein n=1 Tax=Yinghuangia seranimata TaxID=408067 RepID=UPI00248B4CE3|nr:DUF3105 domain-containing protein [Yinghuangia seranimata]MDI2125332.1 DUF3105 domain-containing protein [Yinghuangia seranimata]